MSSAPTESFPLLRFHCFHSLSAQGYRPVLASDCFKLQSQLLSQLLLDYSIRTLCLYFSIFGGVLTLGICLASLLASYRGYTGV